MLDLILVCVEGWLVDVEVIWVDDYVLIVVLVVDGYLGSYVKGFEICGFEGLLVDLVYMVFYVGIVEKDGRIVVVGGWVLIVIGCGVLLIEVYVCVYVLVDVIDWFEGFYCRDIGWCVF